MISEIFKDFNWIAIIVGTLGYFMLGAIWYSFLFKNQWIAYNKIEINHEDVKKGMAAIMFCSFVMMLLTTIGIAFLAYRVGIWGWMSAVKLGAFTGIFFACTSMAINMLYEKKPMTLFFINGGYQVLGNIIAALVVVCWR